MPKRFAIGANLGLPPRFSRKPGRRDRVAQSRRSLQSACIDILESRTLLSTTYFVSPSGSDYASGTASQPFRTIQEAANVANWGDTVEIGGGTYHETVKPAHAGVTFTNYNGQSVTISGADPVSGFWNAGGSIYEANSSVNYGEGNNQVFVDGQMMNEARGPSSSLDLSHPTQLTIGSYSNGTIYDGSLNQPSGFWAGALIHITPGDGWVSYVGQVNSSGPGWINVSLPGLGNLESPVAGNNYYLFGKQNLLDSNGEWYMDSSNHLFLSDASGDNPNYHDVEIKVRSNGFDLSGISNTTIQGINLFACGIHTDWGSSNTTINGIYASYVNQFTNEWGSGWSPPGTQGIELNGSGSTLENSTIAYAAGTAAYIGNSNVTVTNNTIHDVDYSGTDGAGVLVNGNNATVSNNTIYNCGRDGINIQSYISGSQIYSNTIHDFMLQTYDGAGIYTVSNTNGGNIGGNVIYNAHDNNYDGLDAVGILLDNDSANWTVHNNITANVDSGFKANNTSYNENIYSNEFGGTQYAIESNGWTGFAFNWGGSQLHDNVFYNGNLKIGSNVSQWNNSYSGGSPALPGGTTTSYTPPPAPPAPASPPPPPAPSYSSTPAPSSNYASSFSPGSYPPSQDQNVYDPLITAYGGVELGLQFSSSIAGYVTGVTFYKGAQNGGTHTGELYDSSGNLLATATFTNESATGWQQVRFSNPIAISANTTYTVAYHTFSPYITYLPGALTYGLTNNNLHANGSSGMYKYGGQAYTSQNNGQSPAYCVDVLFST